MDTSRSFEENALKKEVLSSQPFTETDSTNGWTHSGTGSMAFSNEKSVSGKGSIRLTFPTDTGKRAVGSPSDPDYATYGNRIVFSIYPDCDGARVVNMNLTFTNVNSTTKEGYNHPSGSHLINLVNKTWNHCFLDIDEYQRDKVMSIRFDTALKGKDRTTGDSAIYYIDNIQSKPPEK